MSIETAMVAVVNGLPSPHNGPSTSANHRLSLIQGDDASSRAPFNAFEIWQPANASPSDTDPNHRRHVVALLPGSSSADQAASRYSTRMNSTTSNATTLVHDFATVSSRAPTTRSSSAINLPLSQGGRSRTGSHSSGRAPSSPRSPTEQNDKFQWQATNKKSSFFNFFALKEPSTMAFAEMRAASAQEGAKKKTNTGVAVVRSGKMPDHVPKVNSRWDGMPKTANIATASSSMNLPGTNQSVSAAASAASALAAKAMHTILENHEGKGKAKEQQKTPGKQPSMDLRGVSAPPLTPEASDSEDFYFPPHPSVVVPRPITSAPHSTGVITAPQSPDRPLPAATITTRTPASPSGATTSTTTANGSDINVRTTGKPTAQAPTIAPALVRKTSTAPLSSTVKREDAAPWEFQDPPPFETPVSSPTAVKQAASPGSFNNKAKSKKMSLFGRK